MLMSTVHSEAASVNIETVRLRVIVAILLLTS
jgi:hypothetical protein